MNLTGVFTAKQSLKHTRKKLLILAGMLLACFNAAKGQAVKRLYIANDDHTDYMWSGTVAQYDSAFVKMLDYHLARIGETKNNADNFQDRFNCDGSYWLTTYAKYRSPAKFNELIEDIRSGHISVPLNCVVSTYGAQPAEAAIRGMYYAGHLERKYKLKFSLAAAMENNTVPLGLSAIWAGSGAKYSWKGVGGYGSQLSQESMKHRKYQLYNYTGLDGSAVTMKWYAVNGNLGGYAECRNYKKGQATDTTRDMMGIVNRLSRLCDTVSQNSNYPYNVAGAFGFGHDDLQSFTSEPYISAAKQSTDARHVVRVSNEEDFFRDVNKAYPRLPALAESYGNEWDLLCASMNETTAQVKRATEKLRTAEAMAAVVSLKSPAFADHLKTAKDLAWDAFGLYWEHNWTADGPIGNKNRGIWQNQVKDQLVSYVDSLYNLSAQTLARQLPKSDETRFFVFNPLSWVRNDVADVAYNGTFPVKVTDLTNKSEVPSQQIIKNGRRFLRIEANGLPSVGYKVYAIRKGKPAIYTNAATVKKDEISNAFYKLKLSPAGVITQLYDKTAANRELVKAIDGKYLNDLGTHDLNAGRVTVENSGPVSVTLKAVSADPVLHTVRITLYSRIKRIDIEDNIDTNFTDNKSWAFSFNIRNQVTRHEELGDVLIVKKKADGGNYADQNARYDWQTFNHFADMSNSDFGITLSNLDCSFFKLGKSTVDSLWSGSPQLNALAGGQIDVKKEDKGVLGVHNQLGQNHFHYHFSLIPHQGVFNATIAMKAALEHQNPPTTGIVQGGRGNTAQNEFSLLRISNPNVLLWSVKPAEEGIGEGLITRCWNMAEHPVQTVIMFYKPIGEVWKTTHLETNQQRIKATGRQFTASFSQQQINTYRTDIISK